MYGQGLGENRLICTLYELVDSFSGLVWWHKENRDLGPECF
jgi:hypothetical protein